MDRDSLVVMTHVPKTAGSSFRKAVIEANVPKEKIYRYGKLKNFVFDMFKNDYAVVVGHVPYGIHRFTTKPVKYIIFLREPIDRAVSEYYFLRSSNATIYGKPDLYDHANSSSLKEFYKDRKFHNLQTRYIAGLISHKLYTKFYSSSFENAIYDKAINNLKSNYFGIGVKEYYKESVTLLQKKLGWNKTKDIYRKDLRITEIKPELKDIDSETLQIINRANNLDLQLYDYALKHLVNIPISLD